MTSTKFFDAFSLVVTRGHSWSLVVTRGHSCVLLDTTRLETDFRWLIICLAKKYFKNDRSYFVILQSFRYKKISKSKKITK